MTFDRKKFYGLNFKWYMTDSVGFVGMFISGYGRIPKFVFSEKERFKTINNFFDNLPVLSENYLSLNNQAKEKNDNIFLDVKAAKRGLFVFDNEEYTDNYRLISIPDENLLLSDLPPQIQKELNILTFKLIQFKDTSRIRITDYFECD